MISDRDDRIANIKRKQEALIVKEERLKDELAEAAETNSSQIITQQTEKTALFHGQQAVMQQLDNLHQHLLRQGDSLNEYVLFIQQNGEIAANDTQNLMRLQAQLCKAMHSMSIVDRQHNMQKEHHEKLIKLQREALAKQSEDKAHLERSILNDLMERDTEVRGVENELKKELDAILKEMSAIRDQLEDSDEEDEDEPKNNEEEEEEEEEELDEEEKAAKEEMMKLLQQRREEIERLEKEIEEREELIEELQIRAGEEPSDDSPRVSPTSKKQVSDDEEEEEAPKAAISKPMESPKKEEKKEDPVDEMAARLQQVMASASDAKVDDVDEMDLLKLAQSRLTGGGDAGGDDDDEEDSEEEEEETETEFDGDYSEGVENSDAAGEQSESAKAKDDDEDYDPTEKKEDPVVES